MVGDLNTELGKIVTPCHGDFQAPALDGPIAPDVSDFLEIINYICLPPSVIVISQIEPRTSILCLALAE